ncbi:MAG: hypothetical protein BWY59_02105 [Verrucomicrobia bacterium ADurb.Bin345]|nr:MAG: hypothetical protein BWY59_02105 [Verrucomicrobia bacterium ADurb.Bin345]
MKKANLKKADGCVLLQNLQVAESFSEKLKGLLGRAGLGRDEGLVLPDCSSIHTFFMRFALDIVFVSKDWRVTEVVHGVSPGNAVRAKAPEGRHTLELGEGRAHELAIAVGDQLVIEYEKPAP